MGALGFLRKLECLMQNNGESRFVPTRTPDWLTTAYCKPM